MGSEGKVEEAQGVVRLVDQLKEEKDQVSLFIKWARHACMFKCLVVRRVTICKLFYRRRSSGGAGTFFQSWPVGANHGGAPLDTISCGPTTLNVEPRRLF